MSEFDDLNTALADLKEQLQRTTTAAQAVNQLGAAAERMQKHAQAVETRLQTCEQGISSLAQTIQGFQQKLADSTARTLGQWQEATADIVQRHGQSHLNAVMEGLQKAGTDFSGSVTALKQEWIQREQSLSRARKLNWMLVILVFSLLLALGLATGTIQSMLKAFAKP